MLLIYNLSYKKSIAQVIQSCITIVIFLKVAIMKTLGERLLMARKAKRMTQQQLAIKAGLTQATISDIERGRNQTTIEAPSLAKALGVTVDYLLLGKNEIQEYEPETATEEHFAFIPFYDAHASCGDGYANGDHAVIKSELAFKRSWLKDEGLQEKDLAIITAKGDSMSPTINDGSILLINTNYKRVESGRVYAIAVDDQVRVKRLFIGIGGDCRIVSDNPNKMLYPDETISPEILEKLHIIGRVVWMGGML